MTPELSPPVQRLAAVLVLLLALFGAVTLVVLPVTGGIGTALDALADGRFEAARLAAMDQQPVPRLARVAPDLVMKAQTQGQAQEQFLARLRTAAADSHAQLQVPQALPSDPAKPFILKVRLQAQGEEAAVIKFINALEDAPPLVRFVDWQLNPAASGQGNLVFEAIAVAVWEAPR